MKILLLAKRFIIGRRLAGLERNDRSRRDVGNRVLAFLEDIAQQFLLSQLQSSVGKLGNINTQMVVGLSVNCDLEALRHHGFEIFNISELVGGDKRVVDMGPDVNTSARRDELDEETEIGGCSSEAVLLQMLGIGVIIRAAGIR